VLKPRVVQLFPMLHSSGEEMLSQVVDLVTVGSAHPAAVIAAAGPAVALIARSPARIGAEIFDALPELAVVSATGSGADCFDIAAATERGIPVLHHPGVAPVPVAEYVMAAMLVMNKRLLMADSFLRAGGSWEPKGRFAGVDAAGGTLGIIGFGAIGREVASRARLGLGMRVIAHDPGKKADVFAACQVVGTGLDELLGQSDVVSLHVPLRPATRRLIGSRELGLMRPSAILINTARGGVVDEGALVAALRSGQIAGAALDVYDPEPPSGGNPLFSLPNTLLTPHIAGLTGPALARLSQEIARELPRALRGERPAHLVNPAAWPPRRLLPQWA
jgi:D-3-phosphoglycerate dehydrogenase / 2-oxoglutarate reductase